MTDITSNNLELALLDQKVAGTFTGKRYAYVAVVKERLSDKPWTLGIAVADERGYNPIDGLEFETSEEAKEIADGMNAHIGLDREDAIKIICSSMRRS